MPEPRSLNGIQFPATQVVHNPHGMSFMCDRHAQQIKNMLTIMGYSAVSTTLQEPAECINCINEHKAEQS